MDIKGRRLRVLPVVVDPQDEEERISLVHEQLGYLGPQRYRIHQPLTALPDAVYRARPEAFVPSLSDPGDSMLPVASGSYIMCEYMADWTDILDQAMWW